MADEHLDVLIVGAGLSGIGAAYRLQERCPGRSFAILEGREAIGGTWDLFRYPGVRADSDIFTLSYPFRPWRGEKAIVDGESILNYLRETAREFDVERKIRFRHRVLSASWSSEEARWTVEAERGASREPVRFTCNFLLMCSGYYSYAAGHLPNFPGIERFAGRVVHPQAWRDDIDWAGKRVIVIGSGATAVSLVPALAETAADVVMLQRSPSWVVAWPDRDGVANALRRVLPAKAAATLARWKNMLLSRYIYRSARKKPEAAKAKLLDMARASLGPDYDIAPHFTPRYNPWEQRLCLAPNGDIFAAIRRGRAAVVTDEIEAFSERGIRLKSGKELAADLIVTATGLVLQPWGGVAIAVDGARVQPWDTMAYKSVMHSGVPNFAAIMGYINASWTLKADLASRYVCRVLNHMAAKGYSRCVPVNDDPGVETLPWCDFSSGYFQRALPILPKQGSKEPWRVHQNYLHDYRALLFARIEDGVLHFGKSAAASASGESGARSIAEQAKAA